MAKPVPYSGSAEDCNGFLLQCSLVLEMQPHMFPTERSKVAFLITQLSGKALLWAESIWSQNHPAVQSYSSFVDHFKEVFGKPSWDSSIGEKLYNLKQGKLSVNEYALQFRILAAKSGWNKQALLTSYHQGLDPQVRLHLAAYKDSIGLERFIQLSIRFATRMQSCLEEHQGQAQLTTILCRPGSVSPLEPAPEPLQLELSCLTPAERQRRLTQNLRMPHSSSSSYVTNILDSGSAGNFISDALCHQLKLKTMATDIFCPRRASKLPPHRPWDCAIDLLPGESVPRGKIYPLSIPEEKAMEEYIKEALAQGYICPSTSPAASSFFFVDKKDGGLRPCMEYRALNHITVKFRYPLPLVPEPLEHLRGATVFTKLGLRSAYNLIQIRKGDEWKTAFITPTGHYKYLVMPYGLVNAPSIYSRNLAEHRHHVAEVLKCLREFQLFLKAKKCSFHQPSVQFLGYNIDSSGIRMDEGKVAAIKDWPTPTTVKKLQRFLGFANFYRRFIQNYSSISNPLTSLLRNKPKSLSWTTSAEETFNTLKEAFTTAPLLVHPDPDEPFIVEVDASTTGVGVVLSQQQGNPSRLHPCAFFSHKLNPAEVNL
ncbi:hypothetical protein QTP70_006922 [Hemibagrus guttatus]|uniref:ribonuclease H n=1 Tax=Hemibagrus guttatus TaxID=175788 RepID=A0AAE0RJ65_9TELE|nr:hypothetical protein QTP70_006922 [Hemibagrus guttatus]